MSFAFRMMCEARCLDTMHVHDEQQVVASKCDFVISVLLLTCCVSADYHGASVKSMYLLPPDG